MIGQICARIVEFFLKKRLVFWGSFTLVLAFLLFGLSRLKINEDLYAIFPQGKEFKKFNDIVQKNKLNKQVVFSIKAQEDEEITLEELESLKTDLEKQFSNELKDIEVAKTVDEGALIAFLQKSSLRNLTTEDYRQIQTKLQPDSIEKGLNRTSKLLTGSNAFFISKLAANDPLGLFYGQLKQLNPNTDSSNYVVKDGVVYSRDEQYAFFFGTINLNQKDTKKLEAFADRLEKFKKTKAKKKRLDFDYFGTFQIAVENAKQVKFDAFLTSIISISAILLLLVFYYRSLLAPFYFLLPGFFGILSGAGLVGYLHPEISAISLATSSVLLGIVLDYSFHFFTHLKHLGSVVKTVKEISSPMTLGSFTTIAALSALLFTNSVVLQNFGLIALCTLSGSVIFTLLFLPVLIELLNIRINENRNYKSSFKLNKTFVRISFLLISLVSLVFLYKSSGVNFDSDMNNLSFHTPGLKQKEKFYTGINPNADKKLFVFSSAPTKEDARFQNDAVYETFVSTKEQYGISELVSLSPYLPSDRSLKKSEDKWIRFWKSNPNVEKKIRQLSPAAGLNANGFQSFFQSIKNPSFDKQEGMELVSEIGLNKFVSEDQGKHTYVTSITVKKDKQDLVKKQLAEIDGVFVLDISEMAKSMLNVVKQDFDYLFLFSSLLVFFSLLVIYGRIELTLFAFFPMVLGWIWILGIASIFDIPFNFINIIVATFIFGLGDDFSIFTTDGLIQQARTGENSLKSTQSGIILSGIATIIGTGVLIFARHPAIHSIGAISVIGIGSIMLITLYVQPRVYNFFVLNRLKKGRGPITFFYFIYSLLLFFYFFVGSLILNILLIFILIPTPMKRIHKRNILNFCISKLAKSTLYAGIHVKKKVVDRHKLDYKNPSVIIPNHTSFLDILVVLMLSPKTIIMVKKWVYNSPIFAPFIRYGGYLFAEEGAEGSLDEIRNRIEQGYSIVIFPEGTRSADGEIKRFHKGAFYISKELNIPIQPLLILGNHEVNPKNDLIINQGQILIKPLDRMVSQEGESYSEFSKRTVRVMREGMLEFRKEYANTSFYTRKVLENYLLKGPILEWYVRVKWMMERKNFDFYNHLIGDKKRIVDVGCGYGYLSIFLNYFDPTRKIVGMDYDEDKVAVANHCIKKSDGLIFQYADIREWDLPEADVYFFNDVIHYLRPEEQLDLLKKVNQKLERNGIIVIRDGIVEFQDRLKNTKLTEILSTKWFKFNKTTNDLSFLSATEIERFATDNGFGFELIEHSSKTSNVLMILKNDKLNSGKKIVVIGSGIGGLVSGLILAKHGYHVQVLEKNHQIGGSLQVFSRDKKIFDTGVHYVGGLDKGENLYKIFKYLEIFDDLEMRRLDDHAFDIVRLANGITVSHGIGYANFRQGLKNSFPDNQEDVDRIVDQIQLYCTYFPLYNIELESEINYVENTEILEVGAWEHLATLTRNEDLIKVILGSGPLYAGLKGVTPFYVVALILNSFIKGSYRFINGGSQIAKLLMKKIAENGGEVLRRKEVISATYHEKGTIRSLICTDGSEFECDFVISNLHPNETVRLFGRDRFKSAYANRVKSLPNTIASFMIYISLHENTLPYFNSNYYDYYTDDIWNEEFHFSDAWPQMTFTSAQVSKNTKEYAESISVMCYLDFNEFKAWEDSVRTIVKESSREEAYEQFKKMCEERILNRIEERFPDIRSKVKNIYSSSPITYRDYVSTPEGSMYGIQKDFKHTHKTQINTKTHIPNLFLTGQNIVFHGILGATIGALVTSFNFVDNKQVVEKIKMYD